MSVGKRTDVTQPLTEHDVAERLDHAATRVLRIMNDLRINHPELLGPVRSSRYLTNALNALAYELERPEWNIQPLPLRSERQPDIPDQPWDYLPGGGTVTYPPPEDGDEPGPHEYFENGQWHE